MGQLGGMIYSSRGLEVKKGQTRSSHHESLGGGSRYTQDGMHCSSHDLRQALERGAHDDIGGGGWVLDRKGRERRRAIPKYQYTRLWVSDG